jgi:TM2 domain-containing membrane protein YozV
MMLGIPLLSFAMILFGLGQFETGGPMSGVGGTLILIGVTLFMINVVKNVKSKAAV